MRECEGSKVRTLTAVVRERVKVGFEFAPWLTHVVEDGRRTPSTPAKRPYRCAGGVEPTLSLGVMAVLLLSPAHHGIQRSHVHPTSTLEDSPVPHTVRTPQ